MNRVATVCAATGILTALLFTSACGGGSQHASTTATVNSACMAQVTKWKKTRGFSDVGSLSSALTTTQSHVNSIANDIQTKANSSQDLLNLAGDIGGLAGLHDDLEQYLPPTCDASLSSDVHTALSAIMPLDMDLLNIEGGLNHGHPATAQTAIAASTPAISKLEGFVSAATKAIPAS
jgi:hypothetical protein